MTKKRWSVFVALSVAAGVASSLFVKQQHQKKANRQQLIALYAGQWWFVDHQQKVQHTLEISPELDLLVDGRSLKPEVMELSAQRLVLRDQYGYLLVLTQPKAQAKTLSFYDEANDTTYHLEEKTERPR